MLIICQTCLRSAARHVRFGSKFLIVARNFGIAHRHTTLAQFRSRKNGRHAGGRLHARRDETGPLSRYDGCWVRLWPTRLGTHAGGWGKGPISPERCRRMLVSESASQSSDLGEYGCNPCNLGVKRRRRHRISSKSGPCGRETPAPPSDFGSVVPTPPGTYRNFTGAGPPHVSKTAVQGKEHGDASVAKPPRPPRAGEHMVLSLCCGCAR